jgi:Flp pilus assembly protein TadG
MRRRPTLAFAGDDTGVSAVEFALLLPLVVALFVGGYALCEAVSISRKVTITTRAMADLTSQYTAMSATDMATVMGAAAEIIAPFASAPLGMRISEITTDGHGTQGYVTWSSGTNMTAYLRGCPFTLPSGVLGFPNVSFIYAETAYAYQPQIGASLLSTVNMGDRLYMLPRASGSISYSGPQSTGSCGS